MVLMGLLMFTGKMNDITGYLSSAGQKTESGKQENGKKQDEKDASGGDEEQTSGKDTSGENASGKSDKEEKDQDSEKVRAHMGELKDQFGKSHKLEDYKGKVIFLNFWATWCGPCRMVSPIVDEIANERDDIKVGKINVDEQGELSMQFRIVSIPTLIVMKNGEVANKAVGAMPKEEILNLLG